MKSKKTLAVGIIALTLAGGPLNASALFSLDEIPQSSPEKILVAVSCGASTTKSYSGGGSTMRRGGAGAGTYVQGGMMLYRLGRHLLKSKKQKSETFYTESEVEAKIAESDNTLAPGETLYHDSEVKIACPEQNITYCASSQSGPAEVFYGEQEIEVKWP
jgi:hypothetical protein